MAQCPKCKAELHFDGDKLRCPTCGYFRDAPYKKVPSQEELLKHNADLTTKYKICFDKLAQIKDVIEGEGTASRRIADITEIVEDG